MGRIRTKWVKNIAEELVKKYPDKFSKDFDKNKKIINELEVMDTNSMRNKVAGCIVKFLKKKKI